MSSYKENEPTKEVNLKDLETKEKYNNIYEDEEESNDIENDETEIASREDNYTEDEDNDEKDESSDEKEDTESIVRKEPEVKKEEPKKKSKKTLYIILGVVGAIIILIITLLIIFLPKNKETESKKQADKVEKESESQFVETINKSVENGSLVKEINKALNDSGVKTDKVYLISIDIDRDGKQELMAYAEDSTKKFLLQFEVTDEIFYEDNFQLDSKDSMGYTYSVDNDKNYFYTQYSGNYTIIERQKKIIKEEDYVKSYFTIANTYNNTPILNNAIKYDLSDNFDAKDLEKKEINEKSLLKDNDISETDVRPAAEKYFKEKLEEEKKKQEEEKKKQEEEEAKKKEEESTFKLEGKTLHYGKYVAETAVMFDSITINKDYTAKVDDKDCKWKKSKFNFSQDSSGDEEDEKESITITCDEGDYNLTAFENDKLSNGGMLEFKFEK